jgi:hypothetical protein
MPSPRLVIALAAALTCGVTIGACGADATIASPGPTTPHATTASVPASTPTTPSTGPATTPDTLPPDTRGSTSAISRDSEAKLTANGGLDLLRACHRRTKSYAKCQTNGPSSRLGSDPSVPWGTELGHVTIIATRTTYTLDSHSYSGAHFLISRTRHGKIERTCSDSVRECDGGTW